MGKSILSGSSAAFAKNVCHNWPNNPMAFSHSNHTSILQIYRNSCPALFYQVSIVCVTNDTLTESLCASLRVPLHKLWTKNWSPAFLHPIQSITVRENKPLWKIYGLSFNCFFFYFFLCVCLQDSRTMSQCGLPAVRELQPPRPLRRCNGSGHLLCWHR